MTAGLRAFLLFLLGTLCLQAVWVLVVPPFRGLDEHDHAFKAAATARGDWGPHHDVSAQGWGSFMSVPRDVVVAATPVCEDLPYTTDDNCRPGEETAPGMVRTATAMADTNPAFYLVIGTAARPFDGAHALYAMRAAAAFLCALALALGLVALRGAARTPLLPSVALLGLTPVVLYSTTVAAPNGIEIAAGFLVWSALLSALSEDQSPAVRDRWVRVATVAAATLVTVRSLGAVWLLLIALCLVVWADRQTLSSLLRRRNTRVCLTVVGAATALAGAWILLARPNRTDTVIGNFDNPLWQVLPQQWVLWFFQSVAAIPARDELAPLPVFVVVFLVWSLLTIAAVKVADRRQRLTLLAVFGLASIVPLTATAWFHHSIGTAWQGRYTLPFAIGFFLLCGFVLDRRTQWTETAHRRAAVGVVAFVGGVSLVCAVHVLDRMIATSPLAETSAWVVPSPWVLVALSAAGTAVLMLAILSPGERDAEDDAPDPGRTSMPASLTAD